MNQDQTEKYFLNKNRGQVMITMAVLFMAISLIIILGLINPTLRNIKVANDLFHSKQSLFLADSGIADAVYRIKNNIPLSNQEILLIDNNFATTSIVDTIDGKTITTTSDYSDYVRKIEVKVNKGVGVSFFYGVQTGNGGFNMSGISHVNGNIYSNGQISGGAVTGSAISATSTIVGIENSKIGTDGIGDAWAHNIESSTVSGALKCQIGFSNNKNCNTAFGDPDPTPMPISAEQIAEWKAEAEAGENYGGDLSPVDAINLGPAMIAGDLNVKKEITMTGTIWVKGKLNFSSTQAKIKLATSTYSSKSGVIIVDKYTTFAGGSQITSTGVDSSYVMLLVTSDCPISSFCDGNNAISVSGGAGSVILAAPYGTISFSGNSNARGVLANKIEMGGSSSIDYELGLANLNFVSGPAGGYQVFSFRETE